jgi:hypothetical protein
MVNDPGKFRSQAGKHEKLDPWKRQETKGKKRKGKRREI